MTLFMNAIQDASFYLIAATFHLSRSVSVTHTATVDNDLSRHRVHTLTKSSRRQSQLNPKTVVLLKILYKRYIRPLTQCKTFCVPVHPP